MKWLSVLCALYVALLLVQPVVAHANVVTETSCCEDSGCAEQGEKTASPCGGESCNPFHIQACACCVGFTTDTFTYTLSSSIITYSFLQMQEMHITPRAASDVWQPPKRS